LLIEFSLKQNIYTYILNLKLRDNIHLALSFHAWLFIKFGIKALWALDNLVQSCKLKLVLNITSFIWTFKFKINLMYSLLYWNLLSFSNVMFYNVNIESNFYNLLFKKFWIQILNHFQFNLNVLTTFCNKLHRIFINSVSNLNPLYFMHVCVLIGWVIIFEIWIFKFKFHLI
jgi:hypothetical protein